MTSWDFIQKQILLGDAATGKSSLLVRLTDDRFLNHSEPTIGVEFGSRLVELTEGEDKGKKVKLQIWDTAGQESFRSITRKFSTKKTPAYHPARTYSLTPTAISPTPLYPSSGSYYRGAGGALLCFDLTSRSTFLSCQSWLIDLKQWGEEDLLVLVVGNKKDLIRSSRRSRDLEEEGGKDGQDSSLTVVEVEGIEEGEEEDGERRLVVPGDGGGGGGVEELRKEVQAWVEEQGLAGYVETSAKDGEGVQEAFNELTRKVHEKHQKALSAQRARGSVNGSKSFRLTRAGASTTNEGGGGCC